VERKAGDVMSSCKLFQIFGVATGNALLLTVCKQKKQNRQEVSDSRVRCTGVCRLGMSATKVTWHGLVRQHDLLVFEALWNSQPVEADESIGDVVLETQVVNEPHSTLTGVAIAAIRLHRLVTETLKCKELAKIPSQHSNPSGHRPNATLCESPSHTMCKTYQLNGSIYIFNTNIRLYVQSLCTIPVPV